jgi:hypothetical protein
VPWVTNRWEARDKGVEAHRVAAERELEVKSALVSKIGAASAGFLSAVEVGLIEPGRTEAPGEYRALKTASLEIASQLAAYFPASGPEVDWRDYTFSLRNAYLALTSEAGSPRSRWLHLLNRYFDRPPDAFAGLCSSAGSQAYARDLRVITLAFQHKEEAVVREISASPTVLTGTPTPDVTVPARIFKESQPKPCRGAGSA